MNEVKFTALDLKRVDRTGVFAGYASLFDVEDLGHDVIAPGAFADTLKRRGTSGVKMLFQHDPAQPIGVWTKLVEDARGLYAEGRLLTELASAREIASLMRAGVLDGLSIGFRALKVRRNRQTGVRRIEAVDLWEISVVTFPMQPEARVTQPPSSASAVQPPFVKRPPTEREFERWLTRDAGLTRNEARALMRSGIKGLEALRDAGAGDADEARLIRSINRATDLVRNSINQQHQR